MKIKIVFLGTQDIVGAINNGGSQVSRRNYELIEQCVGKENLIAGIITEIQQGNDYESSCKVFKRIQRQSHALFQALTFKKYYDFGEEKKIIRWIIKENPDILFLDSSLLGKILKKIPNHIRTITFMHNIEYDYSRNKVKHEGPFYIFSFMASWYNEKIAVKKSNYIISISDRDAYRLQELYHREANCILPVGFKDVFRKELVDRNIYDKKLLFVGSCFAPNYEGIKWFIENVMDKLPEYCLEVVGKGFETRKAELERKNVKVIGTVENLSSYLYSAVAVVLPIQYGSGMKVKTAEIMMYGVNLLATDEALEGYHVDNIDGVYRCNTEDEYIRRIQDIYESGKGNIYKEQVREYFIQHHNVDNQIEIIKNIINNICD